MSEPWPPAEPTAYWPGAPAPVRPRRRHRLRSLLIVLLVLVGLVVVADRVGARVAQSVAADQIRKHENLSSTPTVKVHGFPFLTQLASGHYQHVTLKLADYTASDGNNQIRISDIAIELHSVRVSNNFSDLTAQRATAHALVTYADLSTRLGSTVAYAGDGRISASRSVSVIGVDVHGSVSARPVSSPTALSFADIQAKVEGVSVPQSVMDSLRQFFQTSVDLSDLPFGVRLSSVRATSRGLEFDLTGTNLHYRN